MERTLSLALLSALAVAGASLAPVGRAQAQASTRAYAPEDLRTLGVADQTR